MQPPALLIIACGAIAREVMAVVKANGWNRVKVTQIAAELHNRPEQIPAAVEQKLAAYGAEYDRIFCAYADCGTGGLLDKVLQKHGVERLRGAHCYEFFAGTQAFEALAEAELGTFYLTDYLAKHFDHLIMDGMGLTKHPKLIPLMFNHYRRLVYLVQDPARSYEAEARAAATALGLEFEMITTGYGQLAQELVSYQEEAIRWQP